MNELIPSMNAFHQSFLHDFHLAKDFCITCELDEMDLSMKKSSCWYNDNLPISIAIIKWRKTYKKTRINE